METFFASIRRACNKCANGFSVPPPLLSRLTAFICVHRHARTRIHDIHVHITRALVLTRTAGTLKDAETRNRLQLDSTSRPAGHKTWPRLKRIVSSFSLASLFFSFLPRFPRAHRLLSLIAAWLCVLRIAELQSIYPGDEREKKEDEQRRKMRLLIFRYFA